MDNVLETLEINTNKKSFFYSYNMIFDLDISEHAKIIYLYLCRLVDNNNSCFPSIQKIGSACGISKSTVKRALTELMENGLLIKISQKNGKEHRSNRYIINSEPNEEFIDKNKDLGNIKSKESEKIETKDEDEQIEGQITFDEYNESINNSSKETKEEICENNTTYSGITQNTLDIVVSKSGQVGSHGTQVGSHGTQVGSQRTQVGSQRTQVGSHRTPTLNLYTNNIYINNKYLNKYYIYISSSSYKDLCNKHKELISIIEQEITNLATEIEDDIEFLKIGRKKYSKETIEEALVNFGEEELKQVLDYLNYSNIKSVNAIRTAILNAHKIVLVNTNKKKNRKKETSDVKANSFNNFSNRDYSEEFYNNLMKVNAEKEKNYV